MHGVERESETFMHTLNANGVSTQKSLLGTKNKVVGAVEVIAGDVLGSVFFIGVISKT